MDVQISCLHVRAPCRAEKHFSTLQLQEVKNLQLCWTPQREPSARHYYSPRHTSAKRTLIYVCAASHAVKAIKHGKPYKVTQYGKKLLHGYGWMKQAGHILALKNNYSSAFNVLNWQEMFAYSQRSQSDSCSHSYTESTAFYATSSRPILAPTFAR